MTSVGRILQFPPLPELPEELRGKQFAVVEAVYIGDEASGAELLAPLRALGPAMDTFAMVPPVGLAELHMDPPDPLPYTGEGMMLSELPAQAIDAFVAAAGPELGLAARLGRDQAPRRGALPRQRPARRRSTRSTPSSSRSASASPSTSEMWEANRDQLRLLRKALTPYDSGRQYLNFTEEKTDVSTFYQQKAFQRLQAVKAAVDPDDLFRANHPIPA